MTTSAVLVNPGVFLANPTFSSDWANPAAHLAIDQPYQFDRFDLRGVVNDAIGGGDTRDFVTVNLVKGGYYWFVVNDAADATLQGVPEIELFDADGALQPAVHISVPNSLSFPASNRLEFEAAESGTYRLRIDIDGWAPLQDYQVIGLLDTAGFKLTAIGNVQIPNQNLPPPPQTGTVNLTESNDSFTGSDAPETVAGFGGADTILGMGGNDSLLGGNGGDDLNGNLGDDDVAGGEGADFVRGGQNNDSVYGEGGDDWHVNGNLGDDLVDGGEGNDGVFGGVGNDTLRGGAGNDTMSGDLNDDALFGDAGADTFVFGNGSGSDAIKDFGLATGDVAQLLSNLNGSGIFGFADVLARAGNTPGGVVIDLGGGNFLTMDGITKAQLQADDFLFV